MAVASLSWCERAGLVGGQGPVQEACSRGSSDHSWWHNRHRSITLSSAPVESVPPEPRTINFGVSTDPQLGHVVPDRRFPNFRPLGGRMCGVLLRHPERTEATAIVEGFPSESAAGGVRWPPVSPADQVASRPVGYGRSLASRRPSSTARCRRREQASSCRHAGQTLMCRALGMV